MPPENAVQTQTIVLDGQTTLTVNYEVTLGDLLIATLLFIFILFYALKWLHTLIMERKHDV